MLSTTAPFLLPPTTTTIIITPACSSNCVQNLDIDPLEPSRNLLDFLTHVHILLEASYISPIALNDDSSEYTVASKSKHTKLTATANWVVVPEFGFWRLLLWTRDICRRRGGSGTGLLDRKDQKDKDPEGIEQEREGFDLSWSKRDRPWIAVFRTVLDIATLRDKPLVIASSKNLLAVYLKSVDAISTPAGPMNSYEIKTGPSLTLSSLNTSRTNLSHQIISSPSNQTRDLHIALPGQRTSGFKVRMRKVFMPAVLSDEGGEENEEDPKDVELGNERDSSDEGNRNQDDEEEN
ncbi:hypothetical protein GG344DRAFT_78450 [Lentinula edodes]|nr:hypothetical protein GG344DRAFT_78450 [Lentinula edodes]